MTLLLDWLARESHLLLGWWLAIALAGIAVFPLCLRLLRGLPDRGYTLARALGLLLVASFYWLLTSFGLLENTPGSIVLAWCLAALICLCIGGRINRRDLRLWWTENRALVLVSELIFLALFVGWAAFRAHQNDILYTEKPMELAFMSAAQRSLSFPPADPWLSGYAISYYYLGYVISAMLSLVNGHGSGIGFSLTIAAQFALTGLCGFGVAYNLVRSRATSSSERLHDPEQRRPAILAGILALLLLTLVGNFQAALIEIPYQSKTASLEYLNFWGTQERSGSALAPYTRHPDAPLISDPSDWSYWWWFRASRVLTDYNLDGTLAGIQPIDEFPAFSFLLADNHPHVLALPYAIMTIGLMFNLVNLRRSPRALELLLYGIAIGGLAFLNAWDAPIYLLGLVAAEALRRLTLNNRGRLGVGDFAQLLLFGLALAVIALVAYAPFFIGFRSQAGGFLPNLAQPTALRRFFIVFGPFFAFIPPYLLLETWRARTSQAWNPRLALTLGMALLAILTLAMLLLSLILSNSGGWLPGLGAGDPPSETIGALIERRLSHLGTTLMLLLGIALVIARLYPKRDALPALVFPRATGFALLLIGAGCCLTLIPEFVILRDNFTSRINTVFKFYFQAWTLWSIAAAYGSYSLLADASLPRPRLRWRIVFSALALLALAMGSLYSLFGIPRRAWNETSHRYALPSHFSGPILHVAAGELIDAGAILYSDGGLNQADESSMLRARHGGMVALDENAVIIRKRLTLDGGASYLPADELHIINCLREIAGRQDTVVVEAAQNAYDARYGRVGALTGIPIVLGWENHERQWRGGGYHAAAGDRRRDIDTLYTSDDLSQATDIIKRYNIRYIVYGATERAQYGGRGEDKFLDHLPLVCQANDSRIYSAQSVGE